MNICLLNISKYINYIDYWALYKTNSDNYNNLISNYDKFKLDYIKNKLSIYPLILINLLDPIKLYNIKTINIGNRCGFTDYIDFLRKKDFQNTNLIKGIDMYNRPFISILYNIVSLNNKTEKLYPRVLTIFQRYSDCKYRYVYGGDHIPGTSSVLLILDDTIFTDDIFLIFIELINNKKVEYTYTDIYNLSIKVKLNLINY